MFDSPDNQSPTALRFKADACRILANAIDSAKNKAVWIERAEYWDGLATKVEKESLPKRPK
jgi:hypothetical protein